MDYGVLIALAIVIAAIVYSIVIRPELDEKTALTDEQLALIDNAVKKAVEYAAIAYKDDPEVDESELALKYAFEIVKQAKIIPDEYLGIVQAIIEDKVLKK